MMNRNLILTLLYLLPFWVSGQLYTVKQYQRPEGLSMASVLTVSEDEDGYIWLGTDGMGLVQFDGNLFKSVNTSDQRENRHVGDIFIDGDDFYFSTLYAGVFQVKNGEIVKLDYISEVGSNKGVMTFEDNLIVVQDNGIKIYKDNKIINEENTFPLQEKTVFYGKLEFDEKLFIFTSKGNYLIRNKEISALNKVVTGTKKFNDDAVIGGYIEQDELVLFNQDFSVDYLLRKEHGELKAIENPLSEIVLGNNEIIECWFVRNDKVVAVTSKGKLYVRDIGTHQIKEVEHNYGKSFRKPTDVIIDNNGDIWLTTFHDGVFKISLAPFTQLNLRQLEADQYIDYVAVLKGGELLVSAGGNVLIYDENQANLIKKHEGLSARSFDYYEGQALLAATNGVYKIENYQLTPYAPLQDLMGKRLTFFKYHNGFFWYAISGKGLYQRNVVTGEEVFFEHFPAYFYTAGSLADNDLYLGSNSGLFYYNYDTHELQRFQLDFDSFLLGYYIGNSVVDSHGTLWFSYEKGLLGITKDKQQIAITDEESLPSILIYTLNADKYGRLYVGSNVGVTVLEVSDKGVVTSSETYDYNTGFLGFETHMRSSFQEDSGVIYLGTMQGVTKVVPEYLTKNEKLNKPAIIGLYKNFNEEIKFDKASNRNLILDDDINNLSIVFKCINVSTHSMLYSYRLKELNDEWSEWKEGNSVNFQGLKSGKYTFEVRAKRKNGAESEINSLSFGIEKPFYKSGRFLVPLMVVLTLLSIVIIIKTRTDNKTQFDLMSKDFLGDNMVSKRVLYTGIIAHTFTHILACRVDYSIENYDVISIVYGVSVVAFVYLMSKMKLSQRTMKGTIDFAAITLFLYNFWFLYKSDLHPFYMVNLFVLAVAVPYMFKRMSQAINFSMLFLFSSIVVSIAVESPTYNTTLFLVAIILICFLFIMTTSMLNNDLNKLMFAAGIVNKGSSPIIAFDKLGYIIYSSENIDKLVGKEHQLSGNHVSYLNQFVPKEVNQGKFENVDLLNAFEDGRIFKSPLITTGNKIVYFQWACKDLGPNLKVIMGQDITEQVSLENNYELIVKNADSLIFRLDLDGKFTYLNEKAEEAFQRKGKAVLDTSFFNLIATDYQARVRQFFENNLMERKQGDYIEIPIVNHYGKTQWIGLSVSIIQQSAAENMLSGFLGIGRDVTDAIESNKIIKQQNKQITDSISYASRIQSSLLPEKDVFEKMFEESFLIFKPKDIVSGDFYWLNEVDGKVVLILSDSTGHGVSGAFLTLLGINNLNQVVLDLKELNPARILKLLERKLKESLPQQVEDAISENDMEMSVCVFDKKQNTLEYATAGGRFILAKDNQLKVMKGDNKHIGETALTEDFEYTNHQIDLKSGDVIYLFSDGYFDQFGGRNNKKMTIRRFVEAIEEIQGQSMMVQKKMLEDYFKNWMRNEPQLDDVTVIGIKGLKK